MADRAATLIALAFEELERSKAPGDPDRQMAIRRQVAEKAWAHVAGAADRILGVSARDATAHRERYLRLQALGDRELLLRSSEIQQELHGDRFYHGHCPQPRVEQLLRAAEEFPSRLEAAVRRHRRSP